jgi:hypothetical protein
VCGGEALSPKPKTPKCFAEIYVADPSAKLKIHIQPLNTGLMKSFFRDLLITSTKLWVYQRPKAWRRF